MESDQWTELFAPKRKLETTPSFTLWEAQDLATSRPVFLTASKLPSFAPIAPSRKVMHELAGSPGVPEVVWEGETAFAVQESGTSVWEMVEKSGRMGEDAVRKLGVELLRTLEAVLHRGYFHLRINPSYIRLEPAGKDYWVQGFEGAHSPKDVPVLIPALALPFASTHLLQGERPSPRDDLESLSYVLLFAATGDLPWQDARTSTEVLAIRKSIPSGQIMAGLPEDFAYFHTYVSKLEAEERPNYRALRHRFTAKIGNQQTSAQTIDRLWVRKRYNRRASEPFVGAEEAAVPKLSLDISTSQDSAVPSTLERCDTVKTLKLPCLPAKLRNYRQTI